MTYGNIDNIREILDVIRTENIKLNINNLGDKVAIILVHSSSSILKSIIANIKEDNDSVKERNYSLQSVFNIYLNRPSLFIQGKRKYSKGNQSNNIPSSIDGSYDNYIINRKFFKEKGADIQKLIKQCASIFTKSNDIIKRNARIFDFYQIPRENYLSSPSSLGVTDLLSTIDRFIEVGCHEHIKDNPTYCVKYYSKEVFTAIKAAKRDGKNIERQYIDQNIVRHTINNSIIEEYRNEHINSPLVTSYLDELIDERKCIGPLSNVFENETILLLEAQYKDNDFTYNFNGVLISRLKVLRIYEEIIKNELGNSPELLEYAICKNSILNEDDYQRVKSCIDRIYGIEQGVGGR